MAVNSTTFVHLLLDLRREMVVCQQIAYREVDLTTPHEIPAATGKGAPTAPLPLDSQAWDTLTDTEDLLQEIWYTLGNRSSHPWPYLIAALFHCIDQITASALADTWADALRDAVGRLRKITDRPDPSPGRLAMTPMMLARHAAAYLDAQVSRSTVKSWIARGMLPTQDLGDGYYLVDRDEFVRLVDGWRTRKDG